MKLPFKEKIGHIKDKPFLCKKCNVRYTLFEVNKKDDLHFCGSCFSPVNIENKELPDLQEMINKIDKSFYGIMSRIGSLDDKTDNPKNKIEEAQVDRSKLLEVTDLDV